MRTGTLLVTLALLLAVGCGSLVREREPPARDERARLQRRLEELDGRVDRLDKRVSAMEKFLSPGPIETRAMPPIDGQVMAVSGTYGTVLISAGSEQGVQVGYEFTIFRGEEYIGKVIVDEVERDYCAGYSKKEVERLAIEIGDSAKTRF